MANTERSFSCDANFVYVKRFINSRLVDETILHRSTLQIEPNYEKNHIVLRGELKGSYEIATAILYPETTDTPCNAGSGVIRSYTPECGDGLEYSTQEFADLLDCVLNCGSEEFTFTVTAGTTNDPEDDSRGRTAVSNGGTFHFYTDDSFVVNASGPQGNLELMANISAEVHNAITLITTGPNKGLYAQKDILLSNTPPVLPPTEYGPLLHLDVVSRLIYFWNEDESQWETVSVTGVVYVTADPVAPPPPGVTTYINITTNKIWYWDDTDEEWLTDTETLATTQADPNSPLIVPQYGETKLINKTTNEVWTWDEQDQEWIPISTLISLTDHGNGTYTWNDGVGTTVTIDTRAASNPILDTGGYFTGTNVEDALQELGLSRANMTTLTGRPANSTHMGTFVNGIILNNSTLKDALQALEDAIENTPEIELEEIQTGIYRYTKTGSPFVDINTRASTNLVVPFTGVTSTNVQDALEELQTNIDVVDGKHHPEVTKVVGFNPALRVANVTQEIWLDLTYTGSYDNAASGLTADNIQGAIDELKAILDATGVATTFVNNSDGTYDWDNGLAPITVDTRASSNPVTPTGNISSTNVQDALEELQGDINVLNTFTHVPVVLGVGNSSALALDAITQSLTLDFDAAGSFTADSSTLTSTTLFDAVEELDSKIENLVTDLEVQLAGITVGSRSVLNYIEGTGIDLTITDNVLNSRIDVQIAVDVEANEIPFSPTGNTTSTDVQAAIEELQTELDGLAGATSDFTGLTDTPANYTGASNYIVRVNATPDGLEFVDMSSLNLSDFNDDLTYIAAANLSLGTHNGNTLDVLIDQGSDVTLPAATTSLSGLLTGSDKTKLDGIETGATADQIASEIPVTPVGNLGATDVQAALEELQSDIDALAGGGTFTGLTDTPANFTGAAGYFVKVNSTPNALEFVDGSTINLSDFNDDLIYISAANLSLGAVNANTVQVIIDAGTNVTLPTATTSLAGVLSAADKQKLDYITITQAVDLDNVEQELIDIITLSGVAANSTDLGTFTGTTIQNGRTVKEALQDLETALEAASGVTNLGIANKTATTLDVTSSTGTDATVPAVTGTEAGLMIASDKVKIDGIESNAKDDQIASEVPVTPSGNLTSTDVQAALQELQGDINTINSAGYLTDITGENFTDLADTPTSYAGSSGYIVQVNSTPNGLEFVAKSSVNLSDFNDDLSYLMDANLSLGTITGTTIPLNIDSGTDVVLPSATTTLAGLLNATDKQKLDYLTVTALLDLDALDQLVADLITLTGRGNNATDLGSLTGANWIPDGQSIVDAFTNIDIYAYDLQTLTGIAKGVNNLGTFTGTTISDSVTIKTALQELEIALEAVSGSTNLAIANNTATTLDVTSDTGADATLPAATTLLAGLLIASDKQKLDHITVTQAVDLDNIEQDLADLITLTGLATNSTDLGTFTGTTISNNTNIKNALQQLETAVESAGGDGDVVNNYASIAAPQQFILTGTTPENVTVSNSNSIAFVTHNGQVLHDNEYSLLGTTLTLTPDIVGEAGDEMLVFQHTFASISQPTRYFSALVVDPGTDVGAGTTGDGKAYIMIPEGFVGEITSVDARFEIAGTGTSGTTDLQVARNRGGTYVDVLSTKVTIDANDLRSEGATTPYVINTANDDITGGDLLRIDLDAVSSGGTLPSGLFIGIEITEV